MDKLTVFDKPVDQPRDASLLEKATQIPQQLCMAHWHIRSRAIPNRCNFCCFFLSIMKQRDGIAAAFSWCRCKWTLPYFLPWCDVCCLNPKKETDLFKLFLLCPPWLIRPWRGRRMMDSSSSSPSITECVCSMLTKDRQPIFRFFCQFFSSVKTLATMGTGWLLSENWPFLPNSKELSFRGFVLCARFQSAICLHHFSSWKSCATHTAHCPQVVWAEMHTQLGMHLCRVWLMSCMFGVKMVKFFVTSQLE